MNLEKNIDLLLDKLGRQTRKRIALQVPEGLKTKALEIAGLLEKNGYETIILGDPCYGACDLRIREAEQAGADLIVHIGHKKFVKDIDSTLPVLYFPWKIDISFDRKKILALLKSIKERELSIASSCQYEDALPEIKKVLEDNGKKVKTIGAVLGCSNIDDSCILFIGSGNFHALPNCSYVMDIEKNELRDISKERMVFEKRRYAAIEKAKDAEIFGILVSSKPGQTEITRARRIKEMLEKRNKKAFIIIMDEITSEKLLGIKADCFINTACPRILDSMAVVNESDLGLAFE
ncbi:MAG: diphthamide biosynthesis enzyme Dph2 [Candidatus Aenigmarchaeota archaeon]|nr:diphthamide biosynthesis enzyme Dph2 [Candidatus Aenigmarchaeota archaeon]